MEEKVIEKYTDLVTTREQTKVGFISMALEKNYLALPYIEEAKSLKVLINDIDAPKDLLLQPILRSSLLTASGLSEKSLKFLDDDDKTEAIKGLIENFLEPAGENYKNELIYRYLLIKGDALGGKARNLAGYLGEKKFLRSLISMFKVLNIKFLWRDKTNKNWYDDITVENLEDRINGIHWAYNSIPFTMIFNTNIPLIKKNVDVIILKGLPKDLKNKAFFTYQENYISLGELKGGIDPAGADEHWKTANSALNRIRVGFNSNKVKTFFIGAAIENSMALEIFNQLQSGELNYAANLNNEIQLVNLIKSLITNQS